MAPMHRALRHITQLIQDADVPAVLDGDTIKVGDLAEVDGVPRHTVIAGLRELKPTLRGVIPVVTGSFAQDLDGEVPVYPIRRWETTDRIAERILRLHGMVQSRRDDRSHSTAALADLPAAVGPMEQEDSSAGGTFTWTVNWRDLHRTEPGKINLICADGSYSPYFEALLRIALAEALGDGPIEDVSVYARDGDWVVRYHGRVIGVTVDGVVFNDGRTVDIGDVLAVKF